MKEDREQEAGQAYREGYLAGYRDGLAAGLAGERAEPELLELPVEALGLPARARNCLRGAGCERVGDVARLSAEQILRMRGLGRLSADQIARSLRLHGIRPTAWDTFLI